MEEEMVVKIADNILSPLGNTTDANYQAVKAGHSALSLHHSDNPVVAPYFASLLPEEMLTVEGDYSKFERMCIQSMGVALSQCDVDPTSSKVLFIVSTTKGNVHLLDSKVVATSSDRQGRLLLGDSARTIAAHFGNNVEPVVVSNACISGLCAQIEAMRLIEAGMFDYVVVVGADVQSPFIVSGFQSLKALSDDACRPFDAERRGLNLGEAAATVIYGRLSNTPYTLHPTPYTLHPTPYTPWVIRSGAIRNDANHISGPSRTGEGSYLALRSVLKGLNSNDIAFVNAHGTATLYNDEMESIAITRAGLQNVPVGSLKGYYGHTMGAAGILETLISMQAVEDGTVLATRGFQKLGVSNPILVQNDNGVTDKKTFIKLISGFGGCNAAAAFELLI